MRLGSVFHFIGVILIIFSFFFLFPIIIALIYHSFADIYLFLKIMSISLFTGCIFYFLTYKYKGTDIGHREAFITVTLSWIIIAFLGSLPYYFSKVLPSFTDAYFESISGFTTTGSSVFTDVEHLSKPILFWRALTQWIGGGGIIVFALAILPWMGSGGMQLFKAEVADISVDKLKPRIIDTAKSLWKLYLGITAFIIFMLHISGMNLFDAICHSFTIIATGGFSTKNASIGYYQNPFIEIIVIIGMIMGGTNFSLYFSLLKGDIKKIWKREEFRFYIINLLVLSLLVTINLILTNSFSSFFQALRYGAFQVISLATTTGLTTYDYLKWSPFAQTIILLCLFLGAMAGSTSGGPKIVRILMMIKHIYRELYKLIHPRAIKVIKLDGKPVDDDVLSSIWGFMFIYFITIAIATVIMTAIGLDFLTALSTVVTCLNGVGPAFGKAGPAGDFAFISPIGKWILIFCMLIGRLEYYTVLVLLVPFYWKK